LRQPVAQGLIGFLERLSRDGMLGCKVFAHLDRLRTLAWE
jgi:hypothetical protein